MVTANIYVYLLLRFQTSLSTLSLQSDSLILQLTFQHLLHVNSVLDNLAYREAQCVCVCVVVDLKIVHVPFLFLVHPWIADMMFEVLLSLQTLYHYKTTVRSTNSLLNSVS